MACFEFLLKNEPKIKPNRFSKIRVYYTLIGTLAWCSFCLGCVWSMHVTPVSLVLKPCGFLVQGKKKIKGLLGNICGNLGVMIGLNVN